MTNLCGQSTPLSHHPAARKHTSILLPSSVVARNYTISLYGFAVVIHTTGFMATQAHLLTYRSKE